MIDDDHAASGGTTAAAATRGKLPKVFVFSPWARNTQTEKTTPPRRETTAGKAAQTQPGRPKGTRHRTEKEDTGTQNHEPEKPKREKPRQQGGQRRRHRTKPQGPKTGDQHGGTREWKKGKARTEPRPRPKKEQTRNQKDKKEQNNIKKTPHKEKNRAPNGTPLKRKLDDGFRKMTVSCCQGRALSINKQFSARLS